MYYTWVLSVILIVLQIVDAVSTYIALQRAYTQESNPLIKYLMDKVGVAPALIVIKLFIVAIITCAAYYFPKSTPVTVVIGVSCLLYLWICWNNIRLSAPNK